jgi:tetratricopeptide (TPR) repeat protein
VGSRGASKQTAIELRNWRKAGALSCLIILLTACSGTTPQIAKQKPTAPVPENNTAPKTANTPPAPAGLDTSAPDDNPYLSQTKAVPAAARVAFGKAVNAMQSEDWPRAENLLVQLTADYPALSGPHVNLGITYRHLDKPHSAKQAFHKAIAANGLNLEAYNQLALLEREAGDFRAAETQYLTALKVWPKHAASHKNLGILYDLYLGQWKKALQHFEIYQYLRGEPDRQVSGWIIDLNRRIKESAQAGVQP